MRKVKVGVAGYGVIGQRLADGVALQGDMELVGVADVAPTLAVMALHEKGMPYRLFTAMPEKASLLTDRGIPVSGTLEDLVKEVDIMLDATSAGVGAKNKELYQRYGKKAVFQGGEKNSVADVFFHGYANYEKGLGAEYLKLTSCNTTGLIRAIDCIDRAVGVERTAMTIIRRVADPGDYHRGLTNALEVEHAPSHQCLDLMMIMPHIAATGIPGAHAGDARAHHHPGGDDEDTGGQGRADRDVPRAPAHQDGTPGRRIQGQRVAVPLRARPGQPARGHVRDRGMGRVDRQERRRHHVRAEHTAGSGGDSGEHRRDPCRAEDAGHARGRNRGYQQVSQDEGALSRRQYHESVA